MIRDPARCPDSIAALAQLVAPYAAGATAAQPMCSAEGLVWFASAQSCGNFVTQLNYAIEDTRRDAPKCSADAPGRHSSYRIAREGANLAINASTGGNVVANGVAIVRYGTFRLNFHRFDRFELDLRGRTQP